MSNPVLDQYQLVETRLQEKMLNGTTRCNLCLWRCKISHGQRGFCQAHVNRNGTLYNLSYGIISAIDIDDIEAKPVKHYRPGTKVMSVGSYGCSFRCGGCHNLDISWGVETLDDLAKGHVKRGLGATAKISRCGVKCRRTGYCFYLFRACSLVGICA